ncbi:lipase member H-B-like isoform X2 [Adelges cooleyi]|uniref:lipase member H-B-like isoform X2 n=1 Tax=Adelges cooleyi TaxID=133065 RepID=UPI00217FA2CA|nr:lipase member H-B-like isoform X2 [Adelges cooleyi]
MIVAIALVLVTFHLSDAQLNIGTAGNVLKNTEHAVENTGNTTEETANEELGRTLRPFDPASLKFSYWNHNLGNKKPTVFTIGQEENLLKDWIPEEDLKVVIHGWLATSQDINGVFAIKTAYLNVTKFNVICMDWSAISSNRFYLIPALSTKKVGTYMAEMLKNLVNLVNKGGSTLKSDNIHLIGHSLGAHIAGACGAAFTSGKIGRITGLDPAGPGFEYIIIVDHQLDKTDALFVDIIHTAAGGLGYSSSLGHVDFFPNKGSRPQPGCYDGLNLVKFAHAV